MTKCASKRHLYCTAFVVFFLLLYYLLLLSTLCYFTSHCAGLLHCTLQSCVLHFIGFCFISYLIDLTQDTFYLKVRSNFLNVKLSWRLSSFSLNHHTIWFDMLRYSAILLLFHLRAISNLTFYLSLSLLLSTSLFICDNFERKYSL